MSGLPCDTQPASDAGEQYLASSESHLSANAPWVHRIVGCMIVDGCLWREACSCLERPPL